jgi:hypothetical protein
VTGELSAAATTALSAVEVVRVMSAVGFLKACAERAGVPHASCWQLHHEPDRTFPWRIVDRGASAGDSGSRNVAFTLHAGTAGMLVAELETYGRVLRGIRELRDRGWSIDLMAESRRPPVAS